MVHKMSLHIERVRVADVLPLVDEYGNEFLNRDYSLDVNKAYVAELAASFKDGEPDEPIVVVRDGDVFRIKAGNSRVRAMKELGTEECWAIIDDEGTEQAINETVVRTNTKKKYEAVEESRFVQQLAMFGDDDYVGRVSGIDAERAASIRRARTTVGDKATQLSLDQLCAVDEFDGFPEQQRQIVDAKDDYSWKSILDRLRREKREIVEREAFESEAARLRITLVEDRPDNLSCYICNCEKPGDLIAKYNEASVRYEGIVGRLACAWNGVSVDFYGKPIDAVASKEAAEAAELRRQGELNDSALDSIDEDMLAWVRAMLGRESLKSDTKLRKMPRLLDAAHDAFHEQWYVKEALKFIPEGRGHMLNIPDFIIGYKSARRVNSQFGTMLASRKQLPEHSAQRIGNYVNWIQRHIDDGWKPGEEQQEVIKLAKRKLSQAGKGE